MKINPIKSTKRFVFLLGRSTKYSKYSPEQKAEIGRYAANTNIASAVRKYQADFPNLRKQTVYKFKKAYLKKKESTGKEVIILKAKKRGRPKLLPEEITKKAIQTIKALRLKGAPISYNVINAIAKGIVIANDRTMLVENGGHLHFTDNWARNVLNEVERSEKKMVKRMATTSKIPIAPGLLKEEQLTFQRKILALIKWHDIPKELVLNFDQTPLSYITVGNSTLEFEGATSVPVKGKGKGKQITGTFTVSATGRFLPMQLIYAGKTDRCHPIGIEFPRGFHITHSPNHWSNEELAIQHISEIVIPYVEKMKEELGLPSDQKSLLIYDVFKGQTTERYKEFIQENDLVNVHVPPNLTQKFQPLDINVNGVAKGFLKAEFQKWYTDQIQKQLDDGKGVYEVDIDTRLTRMKPIHARWIISLYDKLRNSEQLIENGFRAASILEALDPQKDFGDEDPFKHLL